MTAPLRRFEEDELEPAIDELPGLSAAQPTGPEPLDLIPYNRVHELEQAAWLGDGIIPDHAISTLFADPGVGKTFILVSLAVAIASGITWGDRECGGGGIVVLVIGEGLAGIPKRIAAALKAAGILDMTVPIYLLPEPLNLMDPMMVRRFIVALRRLDGPIRFIGFDTFLACTPGADQNGASDMGTAYGSLKLIVRETGAAVMTTDHPNNTMKGRPAGSYVKVASADAIWQAERDGERILFKATKLKDFERDTTEVITLRLAKVAGTDSAAVKHVDDLDTAAVGHGLDRVCINALDAVALEEGATTAEWFAAAEEAGCSRASFYRGRKRLLRGHLVEVIGRRFKLTAGGQMLVSRDSGRVS